MTGALHLAATPTPVPVTLEDALPTLIMLLVAGLSAFVFWLWMLVDIFRVPSDDDLRAWSKNGWTILSLVTGPFGALAYLLVGRPSSRSVRRD